MANRRRGRSAQKQADTLLLTGWKKQMQDLIDKNAGTRADGRVASNRTRDITAQVLFAGVNKLHELGMRVQVPSKIREKHIHRLVAHWHSEGKKASTMRTDLSIWRKFADWIGKPSMVKRLPHYLPDVDPKQLKVSGVLMKPKSWTQNGIDVQAKIEEAFQRNERFGLILLVQLAFGLRVKEAICLKPWKADTGMGLTVFPGDGPKGGRPRFIPYLLPEQVVIIRYVKSQVKKLHWLGWQTTRRGEAADLKYNMQEYYRFMREIGVTRRDADVVGHGLRADFAENMARVKGFCPVTLGGKSDQMAWDELQSKLAEVSELLGHARPGITAAYFGAFRRPASGDADVRVTYVGTVVTTLEKSVGAADSEDVPARVTHDGVLPQDVSASAGTSSDFCRVLPPR